MRLPTITVATLVAAAVASIVPAHATVFVTGSTFNVDLVNAPFTATETAHLSPGAQTFTQGGQAITLTVTEMPDGAGGTWIGFDYSGAPIVGNQAANWSINETGIQTNTATNFVGSFLSFDEAGVNLAMNSCGIFGGNFVANSGNPAGGGTGPGCLASGFVDPFPAGALPSLGTFIDPFNFLAATGIDPAAVTSYFEALDFRPQAVVPPVPEPATLGVLGIGLVGLLAARRKRA